MIEPIEFALLGIGAGAIYVLIAQGLVLVYRGSGIVNFAQGGFAMAAAYLYYALFRERWGWSAPLAMVAALVAVAALGALAYLAIAARLRHASALTRTVATLGVLILLLSVFTLWFPPSEYHVAISPLPRDIVTIGDYSVGASRLWLLGIAVVATITLSLVSRFTLIGLATSAAAENQEAAAALGWSPDLIGAANWAVGCAFAGLAGILIADVTGLNIAVLSFLVVNGLAVALVGEFRSFLVTMVAGLALGIAESEMVQYVHQPGARQALPFLVIVTVLAVRGKALPVRDDVFDRLPMLGTGRVQPVPLAAAVVGLVVLVNVLQADWVGAITSTLVTALIMLSLVVLTGYTGQISLAQYALAGLGAWAAGRLVAGQGWPFELAAVAGILAAMAVGMVFALPALRTRGVNLAIVTLGLGIAVQQLVYNNPDYTGGITGTTVGTGDDPLTLFGINVDTVQHPARYAVVVLVALVACVLVVANVRRSRSGRRLIAVRTNERAAAALGISVFGAKVYAFALASAIAGLGGVLLAFRDRSLNFTQFDPFSSITLVAYAVVGGIGFILGVIFGGAFAVGGVTALLGAKLFSNYLSDIASWVVVLGGVTLFAVILFNPDGIAAAVVRRSMSQARWWRQRPARPEPLPEITRQRVSPAVLEVHDLTVRFGGVVALDGVSLHVEPGTVVGLIGPNGAGKTTLIDAVTGFVRPQRGTVLLDNEPIDRLAPHRRVRRGMSRSFQSLELFEDLTVRENLRTASDDRDIAAYLTNLLRPANQPLTPAAVAAIREFGLEPELEQRPTDLPFGRRRLVAIARAVAVEPSVLLLDEPAAGLGDRETAELGELVRRLADEWGLGILLVEHDMAFVMSVCDHVVVLDFGCKIGEGTPAEVQRDPRVVEAYLGDGADTGSETGPDTEVEAPTIVGGGA